MSLLLLFNNNGFERGKGNATLTIGTLIIPDRPVSEGLLIRSYGNLWLTIAKQLGDDWSIAFQITPEKWEEIIAGAFSVAGYSVVLTPRSGDLGRDVIATKDGVGSIRILGSVKAYKPGHLVTRAHVQEMLGVVSVDPKATKGIITTTSDFAPKLLSDPNLAAIIPYRLELMNGQNLQKWLRELANNLPRPDRA